MWPAAGGEYTMSGDHGPATSSGSAAAAAPRSSAAATVLPVAAHSPWQSSPVPYLFGGLAAMLGLIALSLLALACSYWKLSGSLSAGDETTDDDPDRRQDGSRPASAGGFEKEWAGGKGGPDGDAWREHVVVIMAGDERPTFLATPAWGRAAADAVEDAAVSIICGGGEDGRCVECGARARPADPPEDGAAVSPSELSQPGENPSGSSVISHVGHETT